MRLRSLLPLLLLLLAPHPASAQTTRYYLTGHVNSITPLGGPNPSSLAPHTNVGDTINGYFDYNPAFGGFGGPLDLNIDGDVWHTSTFTLTGSIATGTVNLNNFVGSASSPGGIPDAFMLVGLANGAGTFQLGAVNFRDNPVNSLRVDGDIHLATTPEPSSLALAVPGILPGLWWIRRRRLTLQRPSADT